MNEKQKKTLLLSAVALAAIGVGFGSGYLTYRYLVLSSTERKLIAEYRLLKDEWLYGNEDTYLDYQAAYGLIHGVSSATDDPYTFYTQTLADQGLSTSYTAGFGFSSRYYDGGLYVTEVHDGPNSGKLKAGDVLYGVTRDNDGIYTFTDHTYSEISTYIHDEKYVDSTYVFDVKRGSENINLTLTRGSFTERLVDTLVVPSDTNGHTLVLRINTFLGSPSSYLKQYLSQYTQSHVVRKLVFDLRGNGGGYVSEAYNLASAFVRKNTLIYASYDKDGKCLEEHYQKNDPYFSFDSYGIIVDGNSASASELFTLAMRAGTDCTIYGLNSFGKGIAQNFRTFSDNSTVRYTYAYVYGPKRSNETLVQADAIPTYDDRICIHKTGIQPDIVFDNDYSYLALLYDYTQSPAFNESSMAHFIKSINQVYGWNKAINATVHFDDIVTDFTKKINEDYLTTYTPFNENGSMTKVVNDKFNKVTFDCYLSEYDRLTSLVIGA